MDAVPRRQLRQGQHPLQSLQRHGIDICHETVRLWWNRFCPMLVGEIGRKRGQRGRPQAIVTDGLWSGAAMMEIGNVDRQETGRWLNNRAENSHLPCHRRERLGSGSEE